MDIEINEKNVENDFEKEDNTDYESEIEFDEDIIKNDEEVKFLDAILEMKNYCDEKNIFLLNLLKIENLKKFILS